MGTIMLKSHSNAGQLKFYFIQPRVESDLDEKELLRQRFALKFMAKEISKEIIVFVKIGHGSRK